jgi:hypothetical protein
MSKISGLRMAWDESTMEAMASTGGAGIRVSLGHAPARVSSQAMREPTFEVNGHVGLVELRDVDLVVDRKDFIRVL